MKPWDFILLAVVLLGLSGCVQPPPPYDYTAFKKSNPKSILVLPPLNHTPEVNAVHGVLAQIALPLAESGYYVFPVAVVEETFQNNGLSQPDDIHAVSLEKLFQIFRADSVLYLDIKEYGSKYMVFVSDTRVTIDGKLVDLRTGAQLWNGSATASSAEQRSNNSGGLAGMLAQALVEQIVNSMADATYDIAGIADNRLLWAGRPHGMLYGPRSPLYGKEKEQTQ